MTHADRIKAPAPEPCLSCPYRQDVPSGIWHPDEYAKLPQYDKDTYAQPTGVFLCHQGTRRVCAGWAAVHDTPNLLALRMAGMLGMSEGAIQKTIDYTTDVPLFATGAQACEHGLRDIDNPSYRADKLIQGIIRKQERKTGEPTSETT